MSIKAPPHMKSISFVSICEEVKKKFTITKWSQIEREMNTKMHDPAKSEP